MSIFGLLTKLGPLTPTNIAPSHIPLKNICMCPKILVCLSNKCLAYKGGKQQMQPNKDPSVSILDEYSNQFRAAHHSVDQQLEPSLTEVNRLLSHHPDNTAPFFKDPSKPCRSAAAEVGKTREEESLHPTTHNRINCFFLSPAQTCYRHHPRKDLEIWRCLPRSCWSNQTNRAAHALL